MLKVEALQPWEERAEDELRRHRRTPAALSIVMIDLDNLKQVNDTEGHEAGDRLLAAAAAAWTPAIRAVDFLARLGSDEFGLLLPAADASAAAGVVERLRMAVPHIEFSAGIAETGERDDIRSAVRTADEALYAAKAEGRGTTRTGAELHLS